MHGGNWKPCQILTRSQFEVDAEQVGQQVEIVTRAFDTITPVPEHDGGGLLWELRKLRLRSHSTSAQGLLWSRSEQPVEAWGSNSSTRAAEVPQRCIRPMLSPWYTKSRSPRFAGSVQGCGPPPLTSFSKEMQKGVATVANCDSQCWLTKTGNLAEFCQHCRSHRIETTRQ